MKQYFRNSMIAMFVIAAISAISLHSCKKDNDPQKEADNPKPTINGVWERRVNGEVDIDITIAGDSARFTQVYSGDWKTCLEQGLIKLGDLKFKNIVATSDTTWTCEELWYESSWGVISRVYYEPAALTLRHDGVLVGLSEDSVTYYYRK